jgi:hypothetical protein
MSQGYPIHAAFGCCEHVSMYWGDKVPLTDSAWLEEDGTHLLDVLLRDIAAYDAAPNVYGGVARRDTVTKYFAGVIDAGRVVAQARRNGGDMTMPLDALVMATEKFNATRPDPIRPNIV